MPRANRLHVEGGIFHLTHRCHNRQFHLKFARDRNLYRDKLREALQGLRVCVLDYCVTSNHAHLLVDAEDKKEVSVLMQKAAGEFARSYNHRKLRSNAVWGDSFHATLIDSGEYLQRCQRYIELNMVRCGIVEHPRDWEWVGYHEIMGRRQRYRLLDLDRLCWRLGTASLSEVQKNLEIGLQEAIAKECLEREAWWTESLAVGDAGFLKKVQPMILSRRDTEIIELEEGICALKETQIAYGQFSAPKSAAKAE